MNPDYCATRPLVAPDDIEWAFPRGVMQLVAATTDDDGGILIVRLDALSDLGALSGRERRLIRALLDIAHDRLDETEPTQTAGGSR